MQWKRQHQFTLVIISAFGAILGLLLAFIRSPLFSMPQPWQAFVAWLAFPQSYWPWPLLGFLITGLAFYAAQLIRGERP